MILHSQFVLFGAISPICALLLWSQIEFDLKKILVQAANSLTVCRTRSENTNEKLEFVKIVAKDSSRVFSNAMDWSIVLNVC